MCASKRARLFSVCAVVNNCLSFVYDKGHGSLSRTWSLNVSWNSSSLLSLFIHTITRSLANCIWISMGNLKRNNYRSTFCRYIELKCAAYCFHWICSIIWPYNWIFNVKNRFSLNWIKCARGEENARTREEKRLLPRIYYYYYKTKLGLRHFKMSNENKNLSALPDSVRTRYCCICQLCVNMNVNIIYFHSLCIAESRRWQKPRQTFTP